MRLNFCASLGLFAAMSAVVLMVFIEISQISASQKVPRVIRMVYVDTTNVGPALATTGLDTSSLYAAGARTADGQGLRQFYEWGLWSECSSSSLGNTNGAYCAPTHFGNRFQPANTLLTDVPESLRTTVLNGLPNNVFTNDSYLGSFTRAAFYLYFIGAILAGVAFITGFMAHRFAFLISAIAGFLAFLCIGVASAIWLAIIIRTRRAINGFAVGGVNPLHVSWGNGMWIAWAATLASLLSVLPFLLACCFGGSKRSYDYDDEKY